MALRAVPHPGLLFRKKKNPNNGTFAKKRKEIKKGKLFNPV